MGVESAACSHVVCMHFALTFVLPICMLLGALLRMKLGWCTAFELVHCLFKLNC